MWLLEDTADNHYQCLSMFAWNRCGAPAFVASPKHFVFLIAEEAKLRTGLLLARSFHLELLSSR
jgi:hypothetical protein